MLPESSQHSLNMICVMSRNGVALRATPVFLPGESQGQGSLVGCRLWGRTESDTTEVTWRRRRRQQQQRLQSWGGGGAGHVTKRPLPRDRWNEIQSLRRLEVLLRQQSAWQRVALSEMSVPRGGAQPSLRGPPAQGWQVNQGPRHRLRAVSCSQSSRAPEPSSWPSGGGNPFPDLRLLHLMAAVSERPDVRRGRTWMLPLRK